MPGFYRMVSFVYLRDQKTGMNRLPLSVPTLPPSGPGVPGISVWHTGSVSGLRPRPQVPTYGPVSYTHLGGVVINVTMDVLLIGVRGNDKSVPPLRPAHSQFIADTVCLLRGNLARIEGLPYLIAQHIIFFLLFPARHSGIAGLRCV